MKPLLFFFLKEKVKIWLPFTRKKREMAVGGQTTTSLPHDPLSSPSCTQIGQHLYKRKCLLLPSWPTKAALTDSRVAVFPVQEEGWVGFALWATCTRSKQAWTLCEVKELMHTVCMDLRPLMRNRRDKLRPQLKSCPEGVPAAASRLRMLVWPALQTKLLQILAV